MGNIYTYLNWRGDLSLSQSPFNEVDNLILSTLCYLDFTDIVPGMGGESVSIRQAAAEYFARHGEPTTRPDEENAETLALREWMLHLMAQTRRFRNMRLCCLRQLLDAVQVKQFSALTVQVSRKQLYLAFRGTADDLTGWKEDFLLACLPEIPSQEEAVTYSEQVAECYPQQRLLLGGHSKGGNLALYAAVRSSTALRGRIDAVWSNDGPGYAEDFIQSEAYQEMRPKIHCIVPKSSVVGMLLAHAADYEIVDSSQIGLLQHDGLSWQVMGDHFVTLPARTQESIRSDEAIRSWVGSIPPEERLAFVDTLFDVLRSTGAQRLSEVRRDRTKTLLASLPALREVPKEQRDRIREFLLLLSRISKRLNEESKPQSERVLEKVALPRRGRRTKSS